MNDVFFISFNESNCEKNWNRLLEFHKDAKRIHGIRGIDRAHIACDNLSSTDSFWTVDGDNWITKTLEWYEDTNHNLIMFHSIDPFYEDMTLLGGVKLWRKNSMVNKNLDKVDFSLNATVNKKVIDKVFSITKYNTTPFDTWKTSFRHCVKLTSCIFRNRPYANNIDFYLDKWRNTENLDKENSRWAYNGYTDALNFTGEFDNDITQLKKINDFSWLKSFFEQRYGTS
jgi:hypothetical protein